MRVALRSLLVCVLGYVVAGSLLGTCAMASGPGGWSASRDTALSDTPLVIPGAEWLFGIAQRQAALATRRASPEAFVDRLASRTDFEHLGAAGAAHLVREAFPALIEKRDGGMPSLPAGAKLRRFSSVNVAQISLPHHDRGVIESIEPMATRGPSGRFHSINLTLRNKGAFLTPVASQVAVQIPKHLAAGIRAPENAIVLTPVNGLGEALHGSEGAVYGASVLYANTQTDTDTIAKPTSRGFELSAILRSQASTRQLDYRLKLPSRASLVQREQDSPVRVVKDGLTIGTVMPPTAVDATGTPVPVTLAVHGDRLTVSVEDVPGEYEYPIQVDPEYVTGKDRSLTGGVWPVEHPKEGETDWVPTFSSAFSVANTYEKEYKLEGSPEWYTQSWRIEPRTSYNASEFAGIRYRTQGNSTVYNLELYLTGYNEPSQTATAVEYRYNEGRNEGEEEGQDNHVTLSEGIHQSFYEYRPLSMTSGYFSNPLETPRNNSVRLMDYTTKHEGDFGFWTLIYGAQVYVAQEESAYPEATSTSVCKQCGFNNTSPTIAGAGGRTNVLYGSGSWLSPYQGAFEATAHDPGVGVDFAGFTGSIGYYPHWIRKEESKCLGIQCPETYSDQMTYNPSMPNGEDEVEFFAEDAAGLFGDTYAYPKIKVDASKPYNLGFTGMPEIGAEISAASHKLTVHATDGKKPTPSSGIRSVSVSVDGGTPTQLSGAACPEGECTASGEYTLNAESLTEGVHRLVVSAVSNSGEPEAKEFVFDVRHASPVSVGPGSVDPTTGQFTLSAKDVSLGGASGVSRSYQSRNLTAGAIGAFGPQWVMSVGGGENLTVLPTGSVSVVAGSGGQTTFSLNSKSEFEAPKGDENLKLEYKSAEHKYVLKDEKLGTETIFEQPKGTENTPPQASNQFGAESSTLSQPLGDATDASGNVWVADWGHNRIVKFSHTGTLIAAYGTYGSEAGQLNGPWGVAINQSTGNVYVTEEGNNRIDEFSSTGSYIRSFGSYGTAIGNVYLPKGIAISSSGNVWVSDYGNNRLDEFSEAGTPVETVGFGVTNGEEKLQTCTSGCLAGRSGSNNGQLDDPIGLAISGGNLYVAEYGNNRVQELSSSGTYISKFGSTGSGNGQLSGPRSIATEPGTGNLYVADTGNDRVEGFTPAGVYVTKFGSSGSGIGQFSEDKGVAFAPSGSIYVADESTNRVEEWGRSTWWPTSAKGSVPKSTTYLYQSVSGTEGTSIEPSEVLSPTPEGVSCGTKVEELKEEKDRGCHALTFKYSTETSAKGESKSEWGEYKGRLVEVMFHSWGTSSKKMEEKPVARYAYDKQGRLRAEWDPRVESSTACGSPCVALKTAYGYDSEGHVVSLTPPGQESLAFTYGTALGDASTGRILKVTRMPAGLALWNGEGVKNTEAPKLSGTAVVGVTMGVSRGSWSNSPIVYGYQWEDCNSEGKSCTPIAGATNENYKLASSDVGHTVVAQVAAINGDGSITASSSASAVVAASGTKTEGISYSPEQGLAIEYHVPISGTGAPYTLTKEEVEKWGQKDPSEYENNDPVEGLAIFAPDEPQGWPASHYTRATIDYINNKGLTVNTVTPTGGITTTEYNALNEVVRSLSADNRAMAMKEGCKSISKKECRSAEVSEKLDTRTEYDPYGENIVKIIGPEHKIRLANGEEVEARAVSHNYYDEDAQQAEEKNKETYDLITRNTSGALLASGEEKDVRTTITSYNGQEDLGWKLRKPTSVTVDPAGLNIVRTTVYNEASGDVIETEAPGGTAETVYPPSYTGAFGSEGSGTEQFNHPERVAIDASGNVWVDDKGNSRLEKFSASGTYLASYGSAGSGNGQFSNAWGLAINTATGNVYVSDTGNNRIEELNSSGGFVRTFGAVGTGNGQFKGPVGLTIDGKGDVWVVDEGNNRVEEFNETGTYLNQFGSAGSSSGQLKEPFDITMVEGELYVVDTGNNRVEEFTPSGAYISQFGGSGSAEGKFNDPVGIGANSTNGDLIVSDPGNNRVEMFTPAGKFLAQFGHYATSGEGFAGPLGVAVSATGEIYVVDQYNARITHWQLPGAGGTQLVYGSQFGSKGTGNGQFEVPIAPAVDGSGNVWVSDFYDNRIEKFNSAGQFIAAYGSYGTGNGQFKEPGGLDINQSTGNVYISDYGNNRIEELSSSGAFVRAFGSAGSGSGQFNRPGGIRIDSSGNVWVTDIHNNRIQEFSSTGTFIAAYGTAGTGNGQFKEPGDLTFSGGNLYVTDSGNNRIQELSTSGTYINQFGTEGPNSGQLKDPEAIAADATGNLYVTDWGNSRIEEFAANGSFLATFGTKGTGEGQFTEPVGIAINAAGDVYIADTGNDRIEKWFPGNQAAHDTQTIYYSAGTNPTYPNCGNHQEWTSLPCQTQPAAQPDRGLPELPVTTVAYNFWDETETTVERYGTGISATTRTKTETYDPAGRAVTSETKEEKEGKESFNDAHLPAVTDEYNLETGALEKQSSTSGTITRKYNRDGQPIEYKDASGNVTKYVYEEGGDARLLEVSEGKGEEAKSTETFTYSTTTGLMEKLIDTAAGMSVAQGTFTASYDLEGKMTSEIYPNGMCANTTYSAVGEATHLEYIKTRNCSETGAPLWFSDSIVSSIHGETLKQTSSLAEESYTYDDAGRLLETQETPAGKGCVVRLYAYDEESNRTSETAREPGTEGKCATEGGTIEHHTYDEANRLTDAGVAYETFGDITKMPAADAGKHEITSAYYVDNQLATESQNGETTKYLYDPSGRTMETTSEGKTSAKVVSHYASSGNALTWTSEGSEKWTRNVAGIDGALDAIQTSGGTIELQLHDLQGNIVGTVYDNEGETKLHSTYNSTEFGVPQPGTTPPKYAWLGAAGVSTEASFGTGVATQGGASYVPQVARSLQTAPVVPPGSFPNGAPGTQFTAAPVAAGAIAGAQEIASQFWQKAEAERQKAKEEEAAAILRQCQEEGGCGAEIEDEGPQAEGFSFSDPEGLASYKRTQQRATELRVDAVKCDSILAIISEGDANCGSYTEQLVVSAEDLEKCADNKKRHPWGVCYINEERKEDGLGDSIPWSAEAELCTYVITVQGENVYYCPGRRADVFGPWYPK